MDKHGLITEISKLTGYTKGDTEFFLEGFTQALYNAIERGEDVSLVNVGKWFVVEREARKTIHPATREEIEVPAKSIVRYKISKNLQNSLIK